MAELDRLFFSCFGIC